LREHKRKKLDSVRRGRILSLRPSLPEKREKEKTSNLKTSSLWGPLKPS